MQPFSLILPVYNEQEILEKNTNQLVNYLNVLGVAYEIIIVSNGSNDNSVQIGKALQASYPQVKFFALNEKGVGRAFKKGVLEAGYEHIIFMDADLSTDLSFIRQANELLDENVLVMGAKFKGLQNRGAFRKFGSFVFYLSVLLLMGLSYVDYAPGAKGYRKKFLIKYFDYIDDYTSFVLNLVFVASIKKEPVVEIPIICHDYRQSRFNLWHEAASKYKGLLRLKVKQLLGGI